MSARDALVGTIYTFIHPIYGNQNQMAQAVGVMQKKYPRTVGAVHSPPSEGWQAKPDGVVTTVDIFPKFSINVKVSFSDKLEKLKTLQENLI